MTGGSGRSSKKLALPCLSSCNGLVVGLSSRRRNSRSYTFHPSSTVPLSRPSPRSLRCPSSGPNTLVCVPFNLSPSSPERRPPSILFDSAIHTLPGPNPLLVFLSWGSQFPSPPPVLSSKLASLRRPRHSRVSSGEKGPPPRSLRPCRSSRLRRFPLLEAGRFVSPCLQPWGSSGFRRSPKSSFLSNDRRSLLGSSFLSDAPPCGAFPAAPAGPASPRSLAPSPFTSPSFATPCGVRSTSKLDLEALLQCGSPVPVSMSLAPHRPAGMLPWASFLFRVFPLDPVP